MHDMKQYRILILCSSAFSFLLVVIINEIPNKPATKYYNTLQRYYETENNHWRKCFHCYAIRKCNSATAFKEKLPMTINMKELNGNEKYFDLPDNLPANASNPGNYSNRRFNVVWLKHISTFL